MTVEHISFLCFCLNVTDANGMLGVTEECGHPPAIGDGPCNFSTPRSKFFTYML